VLVAHSLGCILVAAWAAHSQNTHRVKAALLVAPGDVERPEVREQLPSWSPIELQSLPFPSVMLASRNDPYCEFERARLFAYAWNAQFMDYGDCGHINADSGLASWPEGHVLLQDLMKD
jgi:predicted alpha/beta hydrolase family esterase